MLDDVDRVQRRHSALGLPLAVVYKYADDQGPYLAAIITFYAFIAIFPLLLLASSILGFILQGHPDLQREVLTSALGQFPIVGDQLGRPEGLTGSTPAIVFGGLAALYGSLGLGQSLQNAMNIAWSVPRNARPNPIMLRVRSLLLLIAAGAAVLGLSTLSVLASNTQVFGSDVDATLRWLIRLLTLAALWGVLTVLFRMAAARAHRVGTAAPGALAVALMWQGLQFLGTVYVTRVLNETSQMNGTFGLVLGLVGIIYIAAIMVVLGMELNVVVARRLWPRALLAPFTDHVDLTEADRRAYLGYVAAQQHKGYQNISVVWEDVENPPEPVAEPPA